MISDDINAHLRGIYRGYPVLNWCFSGEDAECQSWTIIWFDPVFQIQSSGGYEIQFSSCLYVYICFQSWRWWLINSDQRVFSSLSLPSIWCRMCLACAGAGPLALNYAMVGNAHVACSAVVSDKVLTIRIQYWLGKSVETYGQWRFQGWSSRVVTVARFPGNCVLPFVQWSTSDHRHLPPLPPNVIRS